MLLASAENLGRPEVVEELAGAVPCHNLGLADVSGCSKTLVLEDARVDRVKRNTRIGSRLGSRADCFGAGKGDGQAVGTCGYRRFDVLDLPLRVVEGRAPHQGDTHGLGCVFGASLHHRPEHAVVGVGDHVEGQICPLYQVNGLCRCCFGCGRRVCAVVARTCGQDHHEGDYQRNPT